MANAQKEQITKLYMWWNGWVFSPEKTPKVSNVDDEESSGMEEALNCLDNDSDMQVSTNQECGLQEDLIEGFNSLALSSVHQLEGSSSGSSGVPLTQPASLSSSAPGPSSHTHSAEQQEIIIPEISQPPEDSEEIRSQNSKGKGKGKGKGKEKAVNVTEADMQVKKAVTGGKQRGRPKKTVI